jgi:hypothetical protein
MEIMTGHATSTGLPRPSYTAILGKPLRKYVFGRINRSENIKIHLQDVKI